jgi:hypothetical protein
MEEQERQYSNELEKSRQEKLAERVEKGGKTIQNTGRGTQAIGKTARAGGKGMEYTGKGMEYGGKGMRKGGTAMAKAGARITPAGYGAGSLVGVPMMVAGGATAAAGAGMEYGGKGAKYAGKGINKAGKSVDQAGKQMSNFGGKIKDAGGNFKTSLAASRKLNPGNQAKEMAATAKSMAKAVTPWGAMALAKKIDFSKDMFFVPAFIAAVFKDILDFAFIGSLPAIGTVITLCISIFIWFMMLLAGASGKGKVVKGMIKRSMVLIGGTMAEFLFGLNFLPIETITVGIIYFMILSERKK